MKSNPVGHTPIPWTMRERNYGIIQITGNLLPNAPQLIFEPCKMDKANASFIVRCCNNYENVLKSLRTLYKQEVGSETSMAIMGIFKDAGEVLE